MEFVFKRGTELEETRHWKRFEKILQVFYWLVIKLQVDLYKSLQESFAVDNGVEIMEIPVMENPFFLEIWVNSKYIIMGTGRSHCPSGPSTPLVIAKTKICMISGT